jgi:N4-gp56 family major capsid protein
MALMTTTTLGNQYQLVFSKKLLDVAKQRLVMDQPAYKVPFPKNAGSKTMRFMRPRAADASQVQTATEGTPPTVFVEITYTPVDATLVQYIEPAKMSDILTDTDLFSTLKQTVTTMGQDAALHADKVIRDSIIPNVTAAGNKRYAQGIADYATLRAGAPTTSNVSKIIDALDAMTQLTLTMAPQINGDYIGIIAPQVARDLMNDPAWILTGQYGTTKSLLNGEVGMIYGARFLVTTNYWVENGANAAEGTYDNSGTVANKIFASIYCGQQAWGTPIMAGGSPFSPRIIIVDTPDKSDPGNQTTTVTWKSYWTSVLLNALWVVVYRSRSLFA